ncbi:MAG: YegS/Rv2252/BmrU family lipid kinase [Clostridiales bacterium]|nr:YegS/Rv2252/BmrU family lipid kinase [Clostridiales bacterium]
MEEVKKLYFIYNPHSGRGKIRTKLFDILQVFSDAGYELTVCPTQRPKDAVKRISELSDDYELVVCSGGDGTMDEVVQGMMQRKKRIPIGYIPSGTVNDFARSLKIPRNMVQAARIAVEGRDFKCDTGTFNGEHFVYIAAFGIFTDVSYSTSQDMKNILGHIAYLLEGMKRVVNIPTCHMRFESEECSGEGDYIFGMVTNSRSVGGFKSIIGRNVQFDDGVFEVTFIRSPQNPVELQEILSCIVRKEINPRYMDSFRAAHLTVESELPVRWTLDGEYGGEWQTADIQNHRRALKIRVED